MSVIKISQLGELTSAADDDILLITDTDASASKKITVANLVNSKVNTAVTNLVDSAPAALDTLNELAAALGDDANFATTVTTSIGTKWTQDNTKISNWDTAYGWGDHSTEGYLTSFTETDPIVGAITGIVKADGSGNISAATAGTDYLTDSSTNTLTNKSGNISQWTNDSGYLTSFTETNDLTVAVTWANIPDANVPQSAVTQHQAALSITESQISDLGTYLEEGFSVTAGTLTTANITTADFGNYTITETSGELLFATGGNTKMKLDTSGGFTIL